ncbi:MAG TPA: DeoR family transcriptional regulator [Candidatus Staskawiczbacteria bacterium]|nr:DeoR family transcriptional regulator [Candidatus Staskawiczbacteria bacterium]
MNEDFLKTINAVYMLAEYFPEIDPLTMKIKEKVLDISESYVSGKSQKKEIDILLNYLAIAKQLGWMNAMNYLIICKGLEDIKRGLKELPVAPDASVDEDKKENQKLVFPETNIKLSDRQQKIMEFLRQKQRAQVADLQQVLPDVTKRTIRRDLDELLTAGQIARMGEFNQIFYQIA